MRRQIAGVYFDARSSRKTTAELDVSSAGELGVVGVDRARVPLAAVSISPRIGDSPRYIGFPDGAQFETLDNAGVDALLARTGVRGRGGVLHALERNKRLVVATLLVVVAFSWILVRHGIPLLSRELAMAMPQEASEYLGEGVLETLDEYWLEPSELPRAERDRLAGLFASLTPERRDMPALRLVFRNSEAMGANAFALPDGTIVMTDALIGLAGHDQEIAAVMLHEIGHIRHRHSLRAAIQQFGLTLFVMVVTGDVSASSSVVTALPVLLVESGYSRAMESEADSFALRQLRHHGIPPARFAAMLEKLELSHRDSFVECRRQGEPLDVCIARARQASRGGLPEGAGLSAYFSTHPLTAARVERFLQAGEAAPPPSSKP